MRAPGAAKTRVAIGPSRRSVGWRGLRLFGFMCGRAKTRTWSGNVFSAQAAARAPSAYLPTTFMSPISPGRAAGVRFATILRHGTSWTTGPKTYLSERQRLPSSKRGSETCLTSYWGQERDLRRQEP